MVRQQIEKVLEAESPIHRDVLCKRVLDSWGISRMGARISRRFDSLFSAMGVKSTGQEDAVFFWCADVNPLQFDGFRVPAGDEKTRRNLEQIPPEEIASVVKHILRRQIGLELEDLEREVSRVFGFARCTAAMQKCILAGIEVAVARNWATFDGGRVNGVL